MVRIFVILEFIACISPLYETNNLQKYHAMMKARKFRPIVLVVHIIRQNHHDKAISYSN